MDISKIITAEVAWDDIVPQKVDWLFRLYIDGIEVTQAVQYYDSACRCSRRPARRTSSR